MKKVILLVFVLIQAFISQSQVFNTAKTLKKGNFSVGIEPMIITSGGTDFILFGHLGYGLTSGIDLGAKVGVLGGANYVGADVEFAFLKNFSLSTGAHSWGNFGLDATFIGTYGLTKSVNLYGGIDADINFPDNDVKIPLWLPIGVEIGIKKSMAFLFEASVGLTNDAVHMFGGGVNIYF